MLNGMREPEIQENEKNHRKTIQNEAYQSKRKHTKSIITVMCSDDA